MSRKKLFALDVAFSAITNLFELLVVEFFLHGTARIIVPLLSFGRIVVGDFYLEEFGFNWFGLKRREDGRYQMSSDASKVAAVVFWVLCLAAYALYARGF